MSDNSQVIVDIDAGRDEAGHLAEDVHAWLAAQGIIQAEPSDCILGKGQGYAPGPRCGAAVVPGSVDESFRRLATNGLSIQIGRRVFDSGSNGVELTCAACSTSFEPGAEWSDAVGAWFEGNDNAAFACPACGRSQRLAEWRGPWSWGFGYLGLEFWNWPPLSDDFIRAVGEHLRHQTVLVRSHL